MPDPRVHMLGYRYTTATFLKGQGHRSFGCVFFLIKPLLLIPESMFTKFFEFCEIFMKLFVSINDSLV
jgi:hypothetical protein